ncbi:CRP-like cAMP-binding protein [Alkalibaculum bacchi]|uniref:CRP-like cAMP-binding protein n=1 Tax=Alkalibaculum bacchi TaxID=645887 RepID=A0A366HYG9_9FIRM|nr:Crp/Fnr family transcriptional regulator [Alkalibaculum bacchi]RBP59081.1 CRP-like cAMP-binding protein [Alkalibaculum bacchi]
MRENEFLVSHKIDMPTELFKAFNTKEAKLYKSNSLIYRQGEKADNFYFLKKGNVEVFVMSPEGAEKGLTNYKAGEVFGEASFFDGYPRISTAKTITECEIITITRKNIEHFFKEDPSLALKLIELLSKKVLRLSREIDHISFMSAEKRIAEYLLSRSQGINGTIMCTQDDIGNTVGVSRITVSRTLGKFVKDNWIRTGYKKIEIINTKGLMEFLDD